MIDGSIILLIIIFILPISLGIFGLSNFIAERIRQKDNNRKLELKKQLSLERTTAMQLRMFQIENKLTITPNELLDSDNK